MNFLIPIISVLTLVFIDQASKLMVLAKIPESTGLPFIEGFLSLTYIRNEGAVWGIFAGGRWFFLSVAVVVLALLAHYYTRLADDLISKCIKLSFVLIAGGAIGNSIDRFFRGFVVDFIKTDFIDFPIFNFADIYVVTGTALLGIMLIFFVKEEDYIIK